MKLKILVTLVLMIFLIHCNFFKSDSENPQLIKENKKSVDLNSIKIEQIFLKEIDFPSIYTHNNHIYVTGLSLKKKNQYLFYTIDKNLNIIGERRFIKGQGPGEVGGAPFFFHINNQIYILDHTQQRVSIFDRDFNFIEFLNVKFRMASPIFSKDGKSIVFSKWKSGSFGPNSSFAVYSSSFPGLKKRLIHSFPEFDFLLEKKKVIFIGVGGIHYFLRENKIYLLDKDNYVLTMRNKIGDILKQIQVDFKKIKVSKEMEKRWLTEHMKMNPYLEKLNKRIKLRLMEYVQPCAWMFPLKKGFVVVRKKGYGTGCKGFADADYFDYDLNMLGKVKFPCFNEIYMHRRNIFLQYCAIDKDFLYLLNKKEIENDEVIVLEKWRISE